MATFTDTFKRKEVKYRLNAAQHRAVLEALEGRMVADEYGCSRITSLYFDTPNRDLIARSVEKPLYKEKLRVRWYGDVSRYDRVFVELKKKYKGIVYKRRVGCSNAAAQAYLDRVVSFKQACSAYPLADADQQAEALSAQSMQIASEIDAFVDRHALLRPSMYIVCERTAFAAVPGSDFEGLRITFDTGISYRDVLHGDATESAFHPLLSLGEAIMEIKTADSFPLWLVEALNGCESYPSSFSKYGAAYEACDGAKARAPKQVQAEARIGQQADAPTRFARDGEKARLGWRSRTALPSRMDSARAAARDRVPFLDRPDHTGPQRGWHGGSPAFEASRALKAKQHPEPEERLVNGASSSVRHLCAPGSRKGRSAGNHAKQQRRTA